MRKRVLLLLILVIARPAFASDSLVLDQPDAPLQISSYVATYKSPDRGLGDGTIVHRLTVQNTGAARVVAFGIGFRTFDTFKRSMGRPFVGYDMTGVSAGSKTAPIWENRAIAAYLFRGYGTGVSYVAIARMEDGTIWRADENAIGNQLTDLELDMTVSDEFQ